MKGDATRKIVELLSAQPLHTGEIASAVGVDSAVASSLMHSLLRQGRASRRPFQKPTRGRGPRIVNLWSLTSPTPQQETPR